MSFFSSLDIFYPGRPPQLTAVALRSFCNELRTAFVMNDDRPNVELQFGMNDDAAFDATHKVRWDASQTIGTLPLEEDRQEEAWQYARKGTAWTELWPGMESHTKIIHRAYTRLGRLTIAAGDDLKAISDDDPYSGVIPSRLSVSINPVCAMTLDSEPPDDTDLCYGFFDFGFSGMGYFTWQPLADYWKGIAHTATVQTALRLCREAFPVPAGRAEPLKQILGERFLNRDDYRPGDWIVSVSESG